MSGITVERRRDVLKQLHGELVKIMGNIEGLDRAVAQLEKQAYDQSEGNNDMYIRRIAMRLQRTKEKVEATKAQTNQQHRQSNAHLLRPTPSPPPMQQQQQLQHQQYQHTQQQQHAQQHQHLQQHQHTQQHQYQTGQYQQHQQPQYQQRTYHQQAQYGQQQQAPMPAAPVPGAYIQSQSGQQSLQAPPDAYPAHSNQSSSNMHHGMSTQPSMEPDAEIFAEMAQDLLLGPSQAQPGPPSAQPAQSVQPSTQSMQTTPQGYLAPDQSQSWQHQSKPQTASQQPQQMQQVQAHAAHMPAATASTAAQMHWPGQSPHVSQPYSAQTAQHQHSAPQQSGSHDPAITEKYWQLLELMRQEFLADIAEYYNCMAPSIQGQMQPAYASKLAKMKSVIQRLSISRDMPHYHRRRWSQADLEALQHLGKQLRMYCAKIRAALAPIREAKRKELQMAAQRAGQAGHVPVHSGGASQVAQALAHGLPSEAALVRQPSVAAAVHQALPDMPAPPLMDPLSNTSSESRDLPEGASNSGGTAGQESAAAVKQELAPAVEAAGAPAQTLVSRLAGATPGALGRAGAAAEKVLKRKAELISSPSLPQHLKLALQGKGSSSEAFTRVESVNVSQDGQDVSPDRVFDFEAASRSTPSPKEAQQLQQLREKLEKEFEEGLHNHEGKTIIYDSDFPNTLIVRYTPAPAEGASMGGDPKGPCFDRQLSLRVDTGYPESMPAYFRQIAPEQTVQEQSQASAVQERFQAAVTKFQEALTVANLVKLWEQALQ